MESVVPKSLVMALVSVLASTSALAVPTRTEVLKSKLVTLHFPASESVGKVALMHGPKELKEIVAAAIGTVKVEVPAGDLVLLDTGGAVYKTPEILKQVSPEGIDVLRIGGLPLTDAEVGMGDRALACVGHFKYLKQLFVERSESTDAGVAHAAEIPGLLKVRCLITRIDGSCFKELAKIPSLTGLEVLQAVLIPDNFKYLAKFPKLQWLDVHRTHLTLPAVKLIANCSTLTKLDCRTNVGVNDDCLRELSRLKQLRELRLEGTSITIAGLRELKIPALKLLYLPSQARKNLPELQKLFPSTELNFADAAPASAPRNADLRIFAPLR